MAAGAPWQKALTLAVSLVACCVPVHLAAATVEEVRLWRAPDHTRLVFDLSAPVSYSVFRLENPDRVVIDISDSSFAAVLADLDFAGSPLTAVRAGIRDGNDLRLVLDLAGAVEHESFSLGANGEFRDRLVVDLYDAVPRQAATARTTPTSTSPERRDIRVAIVAGHGGEDPGAPSFNRRFWEKDVTLGIARAVEARLGQTPGYRPVMIRNGDYSVDLKSRPVIARDNRVDAYISIHADSYRGSEVQGVTVYALSGETADRENIRRVEQKENMADLLGGIAGDTRIAELEDDLALTLLDLSMAWSMEQGVALGTHVLDSVGSVARLRKNKVQGGNLWELRSPDIPSILIETGYLSNPNEAQKLANRGYQETLADAIVQGIKGYFHERPPEGTLVGWQKQNGIEPVPELYVVKRGDSLSEIAQRYRVGMAELKAANRLSGNTIRIGQQLTIPGAASQGLAAEHRINRGETLSGIAERYRVSLASLRQVNNISGDKIMVGQVLKIPTS